MDKNSKVSSVTEVMALGERVKWFLDDFNTYFLNDP